MNQKTSLQGVVTPWTFTQFLALHHSLVCIASYFRGYELSLRSYRRTQARREFERDLLRAYTEQNGTHAKMAIAEITVKPGFTPVRWRELNAALGKRR